MKKILYLHAGAELYGADNVLLNLLINLDKSKFAPIVILPNNGPLVEKLKENNIDVRVIDYPILRRQYFNITGIIKYILNYYKSCKKISKIIKNEKVDMIHINTIAVLEGVYLSKKCKKILIWHIHEILENPKIVYKFTSYLIGKYSTKIVCVSNAVKSHLLSSKRVSENKIITIYNGIDNNIFKPNNKIDYLYKEFNIPKKSFIIGMIGRVNAIKGQDEFLKIVEPLLKKHNDVYAFLVGGVFAGQEWRFINLKNKITQLDNNDRIFLIDFRNDASNIQSFFDVLVLPSVQKDSFPTVVLESMASKKVIVGYKNGGIVEMIDNGKNGFLSEIGNDKYLSDSLEMLYQNRIVYDNMAKINLEKQKKMFSNDSFIENIEKLYTNTLNK